MKLEGQRRSTRVKDVRLATGKATATDLLRLMKEMPSVGRAEGVVNRDMAGFTQDIFRPGEYATPDRINATQALVRRMMESRMQGWNEIPVVGKRFSRGVGMAGRMAKVKR